MITSTSDFIKYFEGVRKRTLNYIREVPPDQLDWAPKQGEFTPAELIRHIGVTESESKSVASRDNAIRAGRRCPPGRAAPGRFPRTR